jgi:hypothetical protein
VLADADDVDDPDAAGPAARLVAKAVQDAHPENRRQAR